MKKIALIMVAVAVLAMPALAAPKFEKVIPEDAIGIFLVRNCTELGEKFKLHSAYAMWQEPSVQRFLEKPIARLNEELQKVEGKAGVTKDQVLDLFQGQVALFVIGTDKDDVDAALMIEVGGDKTDEALRIVEGIIAAADRENETVQLQTVEEDFEGAKIFKVGPAGVGNTDQGITYSVVKDVLLIGGPRNAVKRAITALHTPPPKSIATSQVYADALERVKSDSDIIAFLNIQQLLAVIKKTAQMNAKPGAATLQLNQMLVAFGVDSLVSASMGIHIGSDEAVSRALLKIAGEPRGIVRLLIPQPGPLHSGADVPADAASFFATRFNFPGAWDEIMTIMQGLNPMAVQGIQQQEQMIAQTTGEPFSIRNDILAVFGPRVSFYQKFDAPFDPKTSQKMIFTLDVTSKAAFDTAINKLRRAVPMAFTMMQSQQYMGHEIFVFSPPQNPNMPPPDPAQRPTPAFAVADNKFIFSNNAETLKTHLRALGKGGDSLIKTESFQRAQQKLPVDQRVMFSHSDPKSQVKMFLGMLRGEQGSMFLNAMRNNAGAGEFLDLFDFSLLPPDEDVVKHLVPSTSCAVRTPDGILMVGWSPAKP